MVDHATAKYLSDNVGTVLAKALADMAVAQPADGVGFLAEWLKQYAEREEEKQRHELEMKELEEQRARSKAALDEEEARAKVQLAEAEAKSAKYQDLMAKFSNPDTEFEESCWGELVSVAQTLTGAKSVYLGLHDEEGLEGEAPGEAPKPCIVYTAASEGSEPMLDRVLPDQTGVTWGAFKQNPEEEEYAKLCLWRPPMPPPPDPADAPEPVEGEDPPAGEAEGEASKAPTLPYYPVSVPCVTDVDQVHFFDLTRLGAYVAVPLVYPSYYTADALNDAKAFGTAKQAADKEYAEARQKKAEELETRKADAERDGKAEELEALKVEEEAFLAEEPPPEKPMELKGKDVRMVLCLDTLGTNAAIDDAQIPELLELCKACALCKSQSETRRVDAQAQTEINQDERAKAEERLSDCRKEAEEALVTEQQEEEAAVPAEEEDKKELIKAKYAYLRAKQVMLSMQAEILELTSWVVATPELMALVANLAFMVSYTKEQIFPKKKDKLSWDKLSTVLSGALFEAYDGCDLTAERRGLIKEHKLKSIKEQGLILDEEKAKIIWPTVEALAAVLRQAVSYREVHLKLRRSEYAKAKEAVAEGEVFTGQPLEEVDDDFEGLAE